MSSMLGKYKISVETANLADGDSIAAYLTDAAGNLLNSVSIGGNRHLLTKAPSEFVDNSAHTDGADYLQAIAVVDSSGNYQPLTLNASGELPVAATVNFAGDYAEDSAHSSGDIGLFNLAVRRDTRSSGVDADGDYASFNVNASGELWVKDADTLAQLVLINNDTTAILADTATIDSQTLSIQNTLTALSKAEDAVHASGDQGIQALAVRKDSQGSNAADGDYTSLQTWSEGSLKVVDVANGALLQQQVSVGTSATLLPATAQASRKSMIVQNAGSSSIWIGSATVTTSGATTGIEVPKGGFIELEVGPAVSVYGRAASGTVAANILELS